MNAAGTNERRTLSDAERLDWLRLARSENVGPITFLALLDRFGSAAAVLDALPALARRGGRRRPIKVCARAAAERELEALALLGGRMIAMPEPDYPEPLAAIADPPPVLAVRGRADLLLAESVAVVGARNASANGLHFAERLAADLGAAGLTVVSGMARGIDGRAHAGAMETGTVAVMGGGVDVVYPKENRSLFERLLADGAVISEAPLGTVPMGRHFPRRNRIIAGLSRGVVVVEGAARSGSLITARLALEQGREVLAVPGSPLDPRASGPNRLIRQGATLVESANDVLDALAEGGRPALSEPRQRWPSDAQFEAPEEDEAPPDARDSVIQLLGSSPVPVDMLVRQSRLTPAMVATILLELELAGRLERHPGNRVSHSQPAA
ncbi:MAG: DNA-processing protein DprA [Rhodospirillales bacterium]|nr:DNA-processing protein DprA [Rhodospirillales bacterium]